MKQVRDFEQEIFAVAKAAGTPFDSRFRKYAKWVDAVDTSKANGYAFEGNIIKSGTIEVEIGTPRLILVSSVSGSAKYHHTYYRVVKLNADGALEATDIAAEDRPAGWALRIRDTIATLLAEVQDAKPATEPEPEYASDAAWLLAHFNSPERDYGWSEEHLISRALKNWRINIQRGAYDEKAEQVS